MKYKKGQIVPRFLVKCKHRKTQHLWKFGSNVQVTGKTVTVLDEAGTCFTRSAKDYIGGRHGKPKVYDRASFEGVTLNLAAIGWHID